MVNHRYRFVSTSGAVSAIYVNGLLLASGTLATAAHQTYSPFYSVKVSKVEMFAPPASQGSSSTCSIEWLGGLGSMGNQEVSDTSNSVSTPAHVSSRPPRLSQASFWNNLTNNQPLFNLTAPSGTIIDITLSLIFSDDEVGFGGGFTPAGYTPVAAATVGQMYYLALDNATTHIYPPVSLNTIV